MATHSSVLAWKVPWTQEPGTQSPFSFKETPEVPHDASPYISMAVT